MDTFLYLNFLMATVALLASPGPAYATVIAIGRSVGWQAGQRFNIGLQIGMGLVAAMTAFGMAAIVLLYPSVRTALGLIGISYLVFLALKIATSPVGKSQGTETVPASFGMGFLVGVTNPKAYVAQSSLFASFYLLPNAPIVDGSIKWLSAVVIMTLAGLGWLWLGAKLGQMSLQPHSERALNIAFAVCILGAGGSALVL